MKNIHYGLVIVIVLVISMQPVNAQTWTWSSDLQAGESFTWEVTENSYSGPEDRETPTGESLTITILQDLDTLNNTVPDCQVPECQVYWIDQNETIMEAYFDITDGEGNTVSDIYIYLYFFPMYLIENDQTTKFFETEQTTYKVEETPYSYIIQQTDSFDIGDIISTKEYQKNTGVLLEYEVEHNFDNFQSLKVMKLVSPVPITTFLTYGLAALAIVILGVLSYRKYKKTRK